MMTVIEPPSALSSPQRRSQVLLMFYLPGQSVTTERLGRINLVDETTARQDIEETGREIQRYHRLTLRSEVDGSYRIEGAAPRPTFMSAACAAAGATPLPAVRQSSFYPGPEKRSLNRKALPVPYTMIPICRRW